MKPTNVLFLCTGNSARSIMAEALLNAAGRGRFHAYSAGSFPVGRVNPQTLDTLRAAGIPVIGLRSKSWREFDKDGMPEMDMIISVCDAAAREVCPVWLGRPARGHWELPNPALVTGTEAEMRAAFRRVLGTIRIMIRSLTSFPNTGFPYSSPNDASELAFMGASTPTWDLRTGSNG